MHERVAQEIELLRERYQSVEHGPNLEWVLVLDFPLPPGRYNRTTTKLLFRIPPGYPNTGPDNFFVPGDLRLADGGVPLGLNQGANSSSGPAPIPGDWAWFSWHPQRWCPTATIGGGDNLLTFLRGVGMCLEGLDAT